MRHTFMLGLCLIAFITRISAQTTFDDYRKTARNTYENHKGKVMSSYEEYRKRINEAYAEFMNGAWREEQPVVAPVPSPVAPPLPIEPPVPAPDPTPLPQTMPEPKETPVDVKTWPFEEDDEQQPEPAVPIDIPEPLPEVEPSPVQSMTVTFFGTSINLDKVSDPPGVWNRDRRSLPEFWSAMADGRYDRLLKQCLDIRTEFRLCDWAYIQLLDEVGRAVCGGKSNEATLLTAYLYAQSGYKMRLATGADGLIMLFASKHWIFDMPYWRLDDTYYYTLDSNAPQQISICDVNFPGEKPLSLYIDNTPKLDMVYGELQSYANPWDASSKLDYRGNINLIQFLNTYPSSVINTDAVTRWAMYAHTPLSAESGAGLRNSIGEGLAGKSVPEGVCAILRWVQREFTYTSDREMWGVADRAMFGDETLYYRKSDCEDHSILFARLVKEIYNLPVALVYYPGHLAAAVRFSPEDNVKGDYITIDGDRFVICDPTYIGASIGMTMPQMDNSTALALVVK